MKQVKRLTNFDEAQDLFRRRKYKFFTNGNFNLNLFAVRNKLINTNNGYNCDLYIAYKDENGIETLKHGKCTTLPGAPFLVKPMNPSGAGAIAEGQYPCLWKPGYFRGTWALIQVQPVWAYRDNNRDKVFDYHVEMIRQWGVEAGFFLHRSFNGSEPATIDNSSAGCIVPQKLTYMNEIEQLVKRQRLTLGSDCVTFTLFSSFDLE